MSNAQVFTGCCCKIKNFAFVQYQTYFCNGAGGYYPVAANKKAEGPKEVPASVTFDDGEIRVTIKK